MHRMILLMMEHIQCKLKWRDAAARELQTHLPNDMKETFLAAWPSLEGLHTISLQYLSAECISYLPTCIGWVTPTIWRLFKSEKAYLHICPLDASSSFQIDSRKAFFTNCLSQVVCQGCAISKEVGLSSSFLFCVRYPKQTCKDKQATFS